MTSFKVDETTKFLLGEVASDALLERIAEAIQTGTHRWVGPDVCETWGLVRSGSADRADVVVYTNGTVDFEVDDSFGF